MKKEDEKDKDDLRNYIGAMFESALLNTSVISDEKPLKEEFVPDKYLHRDNEAKKISRELVSLSIGGDFTNLLLRGSNGTGKTGLVKKIVSTFSEKDGPNPYHLSFASCYINGRISGGASVAISSICKQLGIDKIKKIPFTGLGTGILFDRFREGLDSLNKKVVIIIDEIDRYIKEKKAEDFDLLYALSRIELSRSKIMIIGITNDAGCKDLLDLATSSTFSVIEIHFPQYNRDQIIDILSVRAEKSLLESVFKKTETQASITLCAALIAVRYNGDVRKALFLFRLAVAKAKKRKSSAILEEDIRDAEKGLEFNITVDLIKQLSVQAKATLVVIALLTKETNNSKKHSSGKIYDRYKKLCIQRGIESLTQKRVVDFLAEMERFHIIRREITYGGSYGSKSLCSLDIPIQILEEALGDDKYFGSTIQKIARSYISSYL